MTVCVTPLPATQHKCRNGRKWPVRRLRKQPQLYIPLVVPFAMSLLSFRNIHDPDKKPDDLFFPPCRSTLVDSTADLSEVNDPGASVARHGCNYYYYSRPIYKRPYLLWRSNSTEIFGQLLEPTLWF